MLPPRNLLRIPFVERREFWLVDGDRGLRYANVASDHLTRRRIATVRKHLNSLHGIANAGSQASMMDLPARRGERGQVACVGGTEGARSSFLVSQWLLA
jgi:hypothetical protein